VVTAEGDEVEGLGLLESLQTAGHEGIVPGGFVAGLPLIAENAMNGAQSELNLWATSLSMG
jgi:hypothetical protein